MRTKIILAAIGLASLLLASAPVSAAPDRTGQVSRDQVTHTWTGKTATGVVYTSSVSNELPPCVTPAFSCDQTLIHVIDGGRVTFKIVGQGIAGQETMSDLDLHVYRSDEQGTQGALVGEDTSPDAEETVSIGKAEPGYYLVYVDWYFGAGSYEGSVKLVPTPLPTPA